MSGHAPNDVLVKLPLDVLEKIHGNYKRIGDTEGMSRCDAAMRQRGFEQTPDAAQSGRLWGKLVQLDPVTGVRPAVQYFGDNMSWMKEFMGTGIRGKIRSELTRGENSETYQDIQSRTVTTVLKPGERVVVMRD
ncbi:MAG TPA: hypothetical protein VHB27_12000 [Rhodopila sp.]|uniref:hypothetical protein n=1 Tax=Rhodopila sp. TaxID=2480087 RepID=UPI002BEE7252|nr:hypothetical protein [Rhodopila sp.]HVY15943.1 hypothetical protein [Rhodopila sp.]